MSKRRIIKSLAEIELSAELEQRAIAYDLETDVRPLNDRGRFTAGSGEMAVILPEGDTPELRAARKALRLMEQYGITIPPRGKKK